MTQEQMNEVLKLTALLEHAVKQRNSLNNISGQLSIVIGGSQIDMNHLESKAQDEIVNFLILQTEKMIYNTNEQIVKTLFPNKEISR